MDVSELMDTESKAILRAGYYRVRAAQRADAVRLALEHVDAATKCRAALPAADSDGNAAVVAELHAHVVAASSYLKRARKDLPLANMDDGQDADVAESVDADFETRAQRQTTRATAAAVLLASGDAAGAKKLMKRSPSKPRRR